MEALVVGPCGKVGAQFFDDDGLLGGFNPDEDDLRNAGDLVADWVDDELKATLDDWEFHFDDVRLPVLEELKERGARLVTVFAGEDGDRDHLVEILSDIRHLCTSFDIHLPWEFMYLGDPGAPVRLDKFFGANAVIGRFPPRTNHRSRVKPNILSNKGRLAAAPDSDTRDAAAEDDHDDPNNPYGYAEDIRLPSASQGTEFAIFQNLRIFPRRLRPLTQGHPRALSQLNDFLSLSRHLAHFNCHAVPPDKRNTVKGKLYVTEEFELDDVKVAGVNIYPGAIVVLNCCFGHTMRHGDRHTLAERFLKPKVRAVVATTAAIHDRYATRWARCFYDALFGGQTVAAAIVAARRQLLAEPDADPSAFFYAYLGEPTARLPEPLGDRA